MNQKICVIGGGFFGMYIAAFLKEQGHYVTLFEKENDFMQRASYVNQARVHNGYHYPRSVLTALRSRVSFKRFCQEFPETLCKEFNKYYMIGKVLSKVTASQYEYFCDRIGALCEPAPKSIQNLVNPYLIEKIFHTQEYAFDAVKLKNIMKKRLDQTNVNYYTSVIVKKVRGCEKSGIFVDFSSNNQDHTEKFDNVFNCTYSQINKVVKNSNLEIIPLKHEMTEMCLVEVPDEIKNLGITVMCGPFFSVMPFPPEKIHSFSHVRYTPHYEWYDSNEEYLDSDSLFLKHKRYSAWRTIIKDASRYIPVLGECKYKNSLWDVKTILPRSESDDSRPILFKENYIKGFHCIMGGKIDNVYDVVEIIKKGLYNER
jgi:glycine/D-amino acid oxidase-like deaminating enzyme